MAQKLKRPPRADARTAHDELPVLGLFSYFGGAVTPSRAGYCCAKAAGPTSMVFSRGRQHHQLR